MLTMRLRQSDKVCFSKPSKRFNFVHLHLKWQPFKLWYRKCSAANARGNVYLAEKWTPDVRLKSKRVAIAPQPRSEERRIITYLVPWRASCCWGCGSRTSSWGPGWPCCGWSERERSPASKGSCKAWKRFRKLTLAFLSSCSYGDAVSSKDQVSPRLVNLRNFPIVYKPLHDIICLLILQKVLHT